MLLHRRRSATRLADVHGRGAELVRQLAGILEPPGRLATELGGSCRAYVDDAVGATQRAHPSISALPRLMEDRAAGFLMVRELEASARLLRRHSTRLDLIGALKSRE